MKTLVASVLLVLLLGCGKQEKTEWKPNNLGKLSQTSETFSAYVSSVPASTKGCYWTKDSHWPGMTVMFCNWKTLKPELVIVGKDFDCKDDPANQRTVCTVSQATRSAPAKPSEGKRKSAKNEQAVPKFKVNFKGNICVGESCPPAPKDVRKEKQDGFAILTSPKFVDYGKTIPPFPDPHQLGEWIERNCTVAPVEGKSVRDALRIHCEGK